MIKPLPSVQLTEEIADKFDLASLSIQLSPEGAASATIALEAFYGKDSGNIDPLNGEAMMDVFERRSFVFFVLGELKAKLAEAAGKGLIDQKEADDHLAEIFALYGQINDLFHRSVDLWIKAGLASFPDKIARITK